MPVFEGSFVGSVDFLVHKAEWRPDVRWSILFDTRRQRYRVESEQEAQLLGAKKESDRYELVMSPNQKELIKLMNMDWGQARLAV